MAILKCGWKILNLILGKTCPCLVSPPPNTHIHTRIPNLKGEQGRFKDEERGRELKGRTFTRTHKDSETDMKGEIERRGIKEKGVELHIIRL
jgi:hypothetical protein